MARILLLGGSGMAGVATRTLLGATHPVLAPGRDAFNILTDDPTTLPLDRVDVVVNLAALTPKRRASQDEILAANAHFPHRLAAACRAGAVPLIHLSTDGVFGGAPGPHDEAEPPCPADFNGISKLAGEPPGALVIRTSLIGPELANFTNLTCQILAQTELVGYTDQWWNGITTITFAHCLRAIIRQGRVQPGLRHWHGDSVTKHDLVTMICAAFDHRARIVRGSGDRPRDMRLATCAPQELARLPIPPLAEQIRQMAQFADCRGHWRPPQNDHGGFDDQAF